MADQKVARVQSEEPASSPEPEYDGEIIDESELLNEFDENTEEIDLTHCRIRSIKNLEIVNSEGVCRLPQLKYLGLRQNLITSLNGIEDLPLSIEELDLYDNLIRHGGRVARLVNLKSLDLSFNKLKHIPSYKDDEESDGTVKGVIHLSKLENLYFVQNKISKIEHLFDPELRQAGKPQMADTLKNLELGGNRIRQIENLDGFTNLNQLWLGKNKITEFANLGSNLGATLKILSIQSNRITSLKGLENLTELEELYISHNGLTNISSLENNKKLRIIDISNNMITKLENLSHLTELEELWASYNQLNSFKEVEDQLGHLTKLETVYFEGNPLQTNNRVTYRNKVKLALGPSLKQIDATYITSEI
ncbi:hypothetical protein CANCADRAFT_86714 [Tortispora caseinolytica NRRL Y-17796]|uniref:Protein phosphatase 1 regulatory subunit 7 n=1 Tax=Tortispora caseinolytica NRRL Y-17796 TaxID=767744 RepID=A0A1E4TKZ3_9ASCO|nr:hypothetical protein CANCADRAFT_86714 [Tortispora caseinolytica NRRL Y-17796]